MSADANRTVLFVCHHGAAKSVLAAADFRRVAGEHGIRIAVEAAGVEPSGQVSPAVFHALATDGVDAGLLTPRQVTPSAMAAAWRVITFNLDPTDLPAPRRDVERWDDVPAVSEDFRGARAAINRHLERLIEELEAPDSGKTQSVTRA